MHDFSCTNPDDMNFALLANRVRYFKEDKEGVQTMCKIFEDYGKEVAKEAEQRNLLSNLRTLMETMHLTIEQAMDALRVPSEDRENVKNKIALP